MDYTGINNVWAFLAFSFSSIFGLFQFMTMKETQKIATSNDKHQRSLEDILKQLQQDIEVVSHTTDAAYYLALHANRRIDTRFKENTTSKLLENINTLRNDQQIANQSEFIAKKIRKKNKNNKNA
ncbi:MAG: hypothetical protein KFW21_05900 [Spirochaetota bacterium]|nr:hypothetical protein [Spirochaetota bacterium]